MNVTTEDCMSIVEREEKNNNTWEKKKSLSEREKLGCKTGKYCHPPFVFILS